MFQPKVEQVKSVQNFQSTIRFGAVALALLIIAVLSPPSQAAPGDLDLTFGTAGYTQSDFFGSGSGANGVVLQSDGKIVVAGSAAFGAEASAIDFALARYLPDGSPDSSFGAGGEVTTDFEGNADVASAVALQADGKIVAAGRSQNATGIDFALARYNDDGSLDTTFGPDHNGKVRTVFPSGISRIHAVAIDGDQKIVVAGRAAGANVYDFALARYNTDGSLDATFGSNGTVTSDFSSGETAYALLIQPDEKILVAGSNGSFLLARYHPDGSLDTTFGPDGTGNVRTSFLDNFSLVFSIALQADGALVAAGTVFTDISGIDSSFALARYLPDGELDPGFGSGGQVTTDFSSSGDGAKGVIVQMDGSIIAGGYGGNGPDFSLARYLSNGSLDPTFGVGGKVTTDLGGGDLIQAIALQADGKLVVAGGGDPNQDVIVARYLIAGAATRAQLLNISTRADVGSNESVLIGGFIINGSDPKKVILRAIGPSLPLGGVLADPTFALHEPDGTVVTNDNWRETQEEEISATGLAPTNDLESAIVATLDPGSYTVIMSGQGGGTGVALVEAYDLDEAANSQLANVSTRGSVGTGDHVMIGGFIIGGASQNKSSVVVRGIGPSLGANGVTDPLPDPTLELYDGEGTLLVSNDDWKNAQETEIEDSGLAPGDDQEAAILMDLGPGSYTVILRGKNGATGVGLVEAYNLP